MTPNRAQLVLQLDNIRHNGLWYCLNTAALANGLPPAYFVAIASRETNCVNMLGDYQGGVYHGVGIVQIDVQHSIARDMRNDGSWKTNPQPLIDFGAKLLAANIKAVLGAWEQTAVDDDVLRCSASGYNCGIERALEAEDAGDSDSRTTGKDYGADVMARMAIFAELLAA